MRREDRTSISSHPLADLGWKLLIGLRHRLLLISLSSFVRAKGRSFVPARRTSIASVAVPVIGDLSKPESLAAAFEGVERVFVLSPPIPDMEQMEFNAFHAAVSVGVKRIVYLSNYGAGEFGGPHFHAHGRNEKRLAAMNVEWTVLRPTRFMNFTPYAWASVFRDGVLLEGIGAGKITTIDPADVAAAAFNALTVNGHEGRIYQLTSEDELSASDLAGMLSRKLGRPVTVFEGDAEAMRSALIASGIPEVYAPLMVESFNTYRASLWRVAPETKAILGRAPLPYANRLDRNVEGLRAAVAEMNPAPAPN